MTEDLTPTDVNFEVARINKIYPEEVRGRRPDLESIVRRSDYMMIHTMHEDIDYDLETLGVANIREILPNHLPCGVSFWRGETKVWDGNAKRLLQ